ncbi:MAG: hypothetical protein IKV20_02825 [Clostridia bacterium]|nr:hypothetical protein [Clostridia bacterium]
MGSCNFRGMGFALCLCNTKAKLAIIIRLRSDIIRMKYEDFKTSLEFLTLYGFEYTYDSETGKRECYKNRFVEIILSYNRLDVNNWIPQIYMKAHNRQQIIDIEQAYLILGNRKIKNTFDMLNAVAKNSVVTYGKLFDILIEPQYLNV